MRIVFLFIALCISLGLKAQKNTVTNIVPNPGFEQFSNPPVGWFYKGSDFSYLMRYWSSPTKSSPDAYGQNIRVPAHWKKHGFHLQKPHNGSSMAGLTMFGCENGKPHCREYLQIRLNEELIPGQNYYIEFYVSKLEDGMACNNFGAALSTDVIRSEHTDVLKLDPLFNKIDIIDGNNRKWVKINGGFQADSSYNFLIIGNFYSDRDTDVIPQAGGLNYAYYYFDDFLIKKIPPILDVPEEKEDLSKEELIPGKVIKLKNIYFDFDKWDLHPRSYIELNKLVTILKENPAMKIRINGHTDSIGSDNYNIYLSRKRAKSVIAYLVENDIEFHRLSYKAYGSSKPTESNKYAKGRALNRRVEFKILNVE